MSNDTHDTDVQDAWAAQDDATRTPNPLIIGDYMIRTCATTFPETYGWKAITTRRGHDGSETGPGAFVVVVTSIYDTEDEARTMAISWLPVEGDVKDTATAPAPAPEVEASVYVRQHRLLMQASALLNPTIYELLSDVLTLEVTAPEWSAFTVNEVRRLRGDCLAMATKLLHLAEEKAKWEDEINDMPF